MFLLLFVTSYVDQGVQNVKENAMTMLNELPSINSDKINCSQIANTVNELRKLTKEQRIDLLVEYYQQSKGDDVKVLVICRLLFVNPNGWKPPIIGMLSPSINADV